MIVQKVKTFIESEKLLEAKQKVIVGFSGGADSVALLHILTGLGYECIAAHCNFHLRGQESRRDEQFVIAYCIEHSIHLETINFDTMGVAKERNISIEMAARELRYNWFEELRQKHTAKNITVAHHADDLVETVLLNLIRGSGIKGLTGIQVKNGTIVRPLLCLNRAEIEEYLTCIEQNYVTDSTNNEAIYLRNKIRLDIIPLFETINPSFKKAVLHTATYLKQTEYIYIDYIEKVKKEIVDANSIDIAKLLTYISPQAILHEILVPYNFNSDTVENIFNALNGVSGKQFYSDTHRIIKDRNHLLIDEIEDKIDVVQHFINDGQNGVAYPISMSIRTICNEKQLTISKDKNILYVDKSKLAFPLILRKWKQGDWFIPFGMKGRKKISDYFTDNKFSISDKEKTWLLCSGLDIIWIIGCRSDERFKVTSETSDILILQMKTK